METIKYSFLPSILTRQAESEEAMLAEFEAGNYTIENPLVKYKPYLINRWLQWCFLTQRRRRL